MLDRRQLMAAIAGALAGCRADPPPAADEAPATTVLPFGNGRRPVVALPGKRPLIQLTQRPPQLETPLAILGLDAITPADAFFVRYSMTNLPVELDVAAWRLAVEGAVARPLSLALADLQRLGQAEIVAVNQCAGNSRGFAEPRVGGGQMGHGAMGNARWTGVPLKAVLDAAGVRAGAKEVVFEGLDGPANPAAPDFAKSLGIDHARDGEVLLAWGMNGSPLPFLNGFPLRLVVPGYFGTYWVKHLERITVTDRPFDGYFMAKTYRMPDNACGCVPPGTKPDRTVPIGRFRVRSLITNVESGETVGPGLELRGLAFDGGSGIRRVLVSTDGGRRWADARLGPDLGRYSFRTFAFPVALAPGMHRIMARAQSNAGEWQPFEAGWNPSGYARNVVETIMVRAA